MLDKLKGHLGPLTLGMTSSSGVPKVNTRGVGSFFRNVLLLRHSRSERPRCGLFLWECLPPPQVFVPKVNTQGVGSFFGNVCLLLRRFFPKQNTLPLPRSKSPHLRHFVPKVNALQLPRSKSPLLRCLFPK